MVQKIDGATTSSAVTHRIRISEFYNNFFKSTSPFHMMTEKGLFIGCNNYFDLNTRIILNSFLLVSQRV
jgi:hypothetical protein